MRPKRERFDSEAGLPLGALGAALSAALVCAVFASSAMAETSSSLNGDANAANPNGTSGPRLAAPASSQPANLNDNAKQASSTNATGMIANAGMAGVWFAASFGPSGPCSRWEMCAFSALSLAQVAMMGGTKSGSDRSAAASQYNWDTGGLGDPAGAPSPDAPGGSPLSPGLPDAPGLSGRGAAALGAPGGVLTPEQERKLASLSKSLGAAGYSVAPDGKSLTLPSGKTVPSSAFASDSGLRGLGLSDAQIAEAREVAAKGAAQIKKDLKNYEDGSAGGGGGGFAGMKPFGGGGRAGGLGAYGQLFQQGKKRDLSARSASGMTRQLAGDKIGAAGDDIFQMISRQYKQRDKENEFIK